MKSKVVYLIGICILFIGIIIIQNKQQYDEWSDWAEYDNPIDQYYLLAILSSKTDDNRIECLKAYSAAWEHELDVYLREYESLCNYENDKQMVQDYLTAVHNYIEQSENLLKCFSIDEL